MAFKNSNDYLTGRKPVPTGDGYGVVAVRSTIALTTDDLAINVLGAAAILPARCVPVAMLVDCTKVDSHVTTAVDMSIGLLNADGDAISTAAADGGAAWATGVTIGRTGGQVQVLGLPMVAVTPTDTDRKIMIKMVAGAATAAAGTVGITLLYRSV